MIRCGVFYNPLKQGIKEKVEQLRKTFSDQGIRIVFCVTTEPQDLPKDQPPTHLLVLGGDGSVLRTLQYALQWQIPVLGIHFGTFGFLTRYDYQQVLSDPMEVFTQHLCSSRTLLEIKTDSENAPVQLALNDGVFHRRLYQGIEHYRVEINGTELGEIVSDGLIISTPTGSTAYALSAGGSILCPSCESIQMVPIAPHTLCSRPLILGVESVLQVRSATNTPLNLTIDGASPIQVSYARFCVAADRFLLAHPPTDSYWQTLTKKVLWGKRG